MDDPWKNAWGDASTKDASESAKPSPTAANSTWLTPSITGKFGAAHDDSEADLSAPSWSSGAWGSSADDAGSLWGKTDGATDAGWGASTYEGITFGSTSPSVPTFEDTSTTIIAERESTEESVTVHEEPTVPSVTHTPTIPAIQLDVNPFAVESAPLRPRSQTPPFTAAENAGASPAKAATPLPVSPDGFGTFETGQSSEPEATHEPWTPSLSAGFDSAAVAGESNWGDAWGAEVATNVEDAEEEAAVDEWEAAKREKERRDKLIPPEVLADLMDRCKKFSGEVWPIPDPPPEHKDARYRNLEDIEGLNELFQRLAPHEPPTIPPIHFWRSHAAKEMRTAVKLTRNLPIMRTSPLAHFASSKGSSAWEASIRARKATATDDIPAGWRVVEKEPEAAKEAIDSPKTKAGGLLSFWNRRASAIPAEAVSPISRETSTSPRPASPRGSVISPRASVDSRKPSPSISSLSSVATSLPSTATSAPTSSTSAGGLDFFPPEEPEPPSQAPSAVSRFLSKFSRTRSGGAERHSLALSSDDLEFLGEIVPSHLQQSLQPGIGAGGAQMAGLEAMINSEPILSGKLPAPLAPPPRASAPKRPASFAGLSGEEGAKIPPVLPSQLAPSASQMLSASMMTASKIESSTSTMSEFADFMGLASTPAVADTLSTLVSSRSNTPGSAVGGITAPIARLASSIPLNSTTGTPPPTLPPPPSTLLTTPAATKRTIGSDDEDEDNIPLGKLHSPARNQPPPSLLRPPAFSADDDDDFDDFQSPTNTTIPDANFAVFGSEDPFSTITPLSTAPIMGTTTPSRKPPTASSISSGKADASKASFAIDDFDDFVSSPLRSPSPPRPPSKSPSMLQLANRRKVDATLKIAVDSAHDAQPTNALETLVIDAASRSGQWPAPPTPLPPALQPPPASTQQQDIFVSFGQANAKATPQLPTAKMFESASPPAPTTSRQSAPINPVSNATNDDFGDFFDDWNAQVASPPASIRAAVPSTQTVSSHSRQPSRADHEHTLSLVVKAAATPGVWPAPPSPIPEAITPPGAGNFDYSSSQPPIVPSRSTGPPRAIMSQAKSTPSSGLAPLLPPPGGSGPPRAIMSQKASTSVAPVPFLPPPPGGSHTNSRPSSRMNHSSNPSLHVPTPQHPSSPPAIISAPAPQPTHSRTPSKVDHTHTLSLLNMASARVDAWPAPHSPLPEALSPPPGDIPVLVKPPGDSALQNQDNILDFDWAEAPAVSAPVMPPPPKPLANVAQGSGHLRTGSANQSQGGLSSADLSFFEGL